MKILINTTPSFPMLFYLIVLYCKKEQCTCKGARGMWGADKDMLARLMFRRNEELR